MDQAEDTAAGFTQNSVAQNHGESFSELFDFLDDGFPYPSDSNDVGTQGVEPSNGIFSASTSEIMATPTSPNPSESEVPVPWEIHKSVTDKIELLKKQNSELSLKSQEQESILAQYEDRMAQQMEEIVKLQSEMAEMEEKIKSLDSEKEQYSIRYNEKVAELKQFRGINTDNEKTKLADLQKSLKEESKKLKKAEKELAHITSELHSQQFKHNRYEYAWKKLLNILRKFGEKLKHSNSLPAAEKRMLEEVIRESVKVHQMSVSGESHVYIKKEPNREDTESEEHTLDSINVDMPTASIESIATNDDNLSDSQVQNETVEQRNGFLPFDSLNLLNTGKAVTSTPNSNFQSNPNLLCLSEMSEIERMQNFNNSDSSTILPVQSSQKSRNIGELQSNSNAVLGNVFCIAKPKDSSLNSDQNVPEIDFICSDTDSVNFTEEDYSQVKKVVYTDENDLDKMLLSPITSPYRNSPVYRKKIESQECSNSHHAVEHPHSSSFNQNNMATPKKLPAKYSEKRNNLYHQTSRGFEPHVEESARNFDTSLSSKSPVKPHNNSSNGEVETIPSEFHYISSMHMNNTTFIFNEGSAICDVLINTATGQSISSVTRPTSDDLSSNLSNNTSSPLSSFFNNLNERRRNVLSLYQTSCDSVARIKKEKSSLSSTKPDISQNFTFPPAASQEVTTATVNKHSSQNFDSELHSSRTEDYPGVPTILSDKNMQSTPETSGNMHILRGERESQDYPDVPTCLNPKKVQITSKTSEKNHRFLVKENQDYLGVPACLSEENVRNTSQSSVKVSRLPVEKKGKDSVDLPNNNCQQTLNSCKRSGENETYHLLKCFANTQDRSEKQHSVNGNDKIQTKKQFQNSPNTSTYLPRREKEHDNSVSLFSSSGQCSIECEERNVPVNVGCSDSIAVDGELSVERNNKLNYFAINEKFSNSKQAESEMKLQILSPPTSPFSCFENGQLSPVKFTDGYANSTARNKVEKVNTKKNSIKRQRKVQINEAVNTAAVISSTEKQDSEKTENTEKLEAATADRTLNSLNISQAVKKRKVSNDFSTTEYGIKESSDSGATTKENGSNDNLSGQNSIKELNRASSVDKITPLIETQILLPCKSPVKMKEAVGFEAANHSSFMNSPISNRNSDSSKMSHKQKKSKLDLNEMSLKLRNQKIVQSLNQPLLGDSFSISKSLTNNTKHSPDLTTNPAELNEKKLISNKPDSDMQVTQEIDTQFGNNKSNEKVTDSAPSSEIIAPVFKEINTVEPSDIFSAEKLESGNFDASDISKKKASSKTVSKLSNKKKINSKLQANIEVNSVIAALKRSPRIAERQRANTVIHRTRKITSLLDKKPVQNVSKDSKNRRKSKSESSESSVIEKFEIKPGDNDNIVMNKKLHKTKISPGVDKPSKKSEKQLQNNIFGNSTCETVESVSYSEETEKDVVDAQDIVGNCAEMQEVISCSEPQGLINSKTNHSKNRTEYSDDSEENLVTAKNVRKKSHLNRNFTHKKKDNNPPCIVEQFSNGISTATEITKVNHSDLISKISSNEKCPESPLNNFTSKSKTGCSPFKPPECPNVISENSLNSVLTVQAEINPFYSSDISKIDHCVPNNSPKSSQSVNSCISTSHINGNGLLNGSCQSDMSDDESTLVIVETIEEDSRFEKESSPKPEKIIKSSVNPCKRGPANNGKKAKSSKKYKQCNGNISSIPSIPKALEELEKLKFDESHSKLLMHTLVNAILNPSNALDAKHAVFEIIKYLSNSKRNPFYTFRQSDSSLVFPPLEHCIVESIIRVQAKAKTRLQGLMPYAVNTLNYLVLSKNIQIYGLSAFCRVLTSLCKYLGNVNRPIMLCSDLLKMQHQFAPFLIASVVGVWPDLFHVTESSTELEQHFHSAIAYGVSKKPTTLHANQWKQCNLVLSEYLSAQPPSHITEITETIMEQLKFVLEDEPVEHEFMLIDPLVIFSAYEGWEWAHQNILDKFIVPSLKKYAKEKNDRAFSVLSTLYADTVLLSPNPSFYLKHMESYFFRNNVSGPIKSAAALSLLKIILKIQVPVPDFLEEWISDNQDVLANTPAVILLTKRLIADSPELTLDDIIG